MGVRVFSRRQVIGWGGAAGVLGLLSKVPLAQADDERPHFLIAIIVSGGVDNTYVFDGRHRKLTEKNLKQNYLLRNDAHPDTTRPEEFTDEKLLERAITCERTGSRALRSPFMDDVWNAHRDCLSIVNGVYMLKNDVGHPSNQAYFMANAPSMGGGIFPPVIGSRQSMPVDTLALGFSSNIKNLAKSLVTSGGVDSIAALGAGAYKLDPASPVGLHILAAADGNGAGDGMFAEGSRHLADALRASRRLADGLSKLSPSTAGPTAFPPSLPSKVAGVLTLFQTGITRVASIFQNDVGGTNTDMHGAAAGQSDTVKMFTRYAQDLRQMIDLLKNTMYVDENGRSTPFIELTTFVVGSEFGRTNKSLAGTPPVGATGTDHNPFSNSVLLGGKGIVPGMVVGESDLTDCDENGVFTDVSGAHRQIDAKLLQIAGKPFDFDTQRVRDDRPGSFAETDYIWMPSVTNTLFDAFGVPTQQHYKMNGRTAPILSCLRTGTR